MSVTSYIPAKTAYSYSRKDYENSSHIGVWAIQRYLGLTEDGYFGPKTEEKVKLLQKATKLTVDGIAGPATQGKIIKLCVPAGEEINLLPSGILNGIATGEGGNLIAPVAWGSPGGVDCGPLQYRVYDLRGQGAPWRLAYDSKGNPTGPTGELWAAARFDKTKIEQAFSTKSVFIKLGADLRKAKEKFYSREPKSDQKYSPYQRHRRSWQLAVLDHNWPAGADRLSYGYALPDREADWVPAAVKAKGVNTWAEWANYYINTMTQGVDLNKP